MDLERMFVVNKVVDNNRITRFFGGVSHVALVGLCLLTSGLSAAFATNYTWDIGGPNDKWSVAGNWGGASPPVNSVAGLTNADVFFAGTVRLVPKVDQTFFVRSLNFNSGAGAFTITPQNSEILRIGAGGIVNNSLNVQTIAISLSLSNSQTWNAAAGNLNISELVNLNNSTLTIDGLFNSAISNTVSGTGGLVKNGSGTLNLAGLAANTFSGGVVVNAGTLTAQKVNAFGTGLVTVNSGALNVATHNQSVGTVTLGGGVINGSTGVITGVTYVAQSGTINARLGGSGTMTKSTAGTVTLTSSNVFSGNTTINAGRLVVNNTSGSGTGSGNVTINNSGVLAGTGIITGAVTNKSGGTISAGDANLIAQFNTGTQIWGGGATNLWEIKDVDAGEGVGWDILNISGVLNLTATTGNKFVIDLRSLTPGNVPGLVNDFNSSQSYIWTIARTVSGITFGAGESEATVFQLLLGGFVNSVDGGNFSVATGNATKDLNLVFTPAAAPEPTAISLLVLGLGLILHRGRRPY